MNELPKQKLIELIKEYGFSLCDDPKRCKGFLLDYCGEHRREINLLINALNEGITTELRNLSQGIPKAIILSRLKDKLQTNLSVTEEAAIWAVQSWAIALGTVTEAELNLLTQPSPNPHSNPTSLFPTVTVGENLNTETGTELKQKPSSSILITTVVISILLALGYLGGFWMIDSMKQTQQNLAQAEREKERAEALLAEEQKKREEEELKRQEEQKKREEEQRKREEEQRKRQEAEALRQEAERKRLEAERKRLEAERKAAQQPKTVYVPVQPSSPPPATTSNTNARVGGKTGWKNIRSGPSTNYGVLGEAYTGEPIQVLGNGRDEEGYLWYRVYHPKSGTNGWIAAQLVDF